MRDVSGFASYLLRQLFKIKFRIFAMLKMKGNGLDIILEKVLTIFKQKHLG